MKESISYSFLLNIVILFIFVCFAIVMGVFSYYKAFRANTIIINAIEKYEGYNCLSAEEAATKLASIGYNVPFDVKCKSSYGEPCVVDSNKNYAVVNFNLDYNDGEWMNKGNDNGTIEEMNSKIDCDADGNCTSTKTYQYGVYTYMYVDLPVISGFIRVPFFAKTEELHEFRDLVITNIGDVQRAYDRNFLPRDVIYDILVDKDFSSNIRKKYKNDTEFIGFLDEYLDGKDDSNYIKFYAQDLLSLDNDIFNAGNDDFDDVVFYNPVYAWHKEYFINNARTSVLTKSLIFSGKHQDVLNGFNFGCGTETIIDYSYD